MNEEELIAKEKAKTYVEFLEVRATEDSEEKAFEAGFYSGISYARMKMRDAFDLLEKFKDGKPKY